MVCYCQFVFVWIFEIGVVIVFVIFWLDIWWVYVVVVVGQGQCVVLIYGGVVFGEEGCYLVVVGCMGGVVLGSIDQEQWVFDVVLLLVGLGVFGFDEVQFQVEVFFEQGLVEVECVVEVGDVDEEV